MNARDEQFEAMLQRAWRAAYDAVGMAENQGRRRSVRRLKYVCNVINEVQADIELTRRFSRDNFEANWQRFAGGAGERSNER